MWFEYVASKNNIADLPSREGFDEMASLVSSTEVELVWPSVAELGGWVSAAEVAAAARDAARRR